MVASALQYEVLLYTFELKSADNMPCVRTALPCEQSANTAGLVLVRSASPGAVRALRARAGLPLWHVFGSWVAETGPQGQTQVVKSIYAHFRRACALVSNSTVLELWKQS